MSGTENNIRISANVCGTYNLKKITVNQFGIIDGTSLFQILGVLGGILYCYSNSKRTFCKQTVETLIRCRVLRRLVWVSIVCPCPTKRTLGLNGLSIYNLTGQNKLSPIFPIAIMLNAKFLFVYLKKR